MAKSIRKIIGSLMAIMLFILQLPYVIAKETPQETIRVGYYEDGDYMARNQQGEYVGYNIEYLQEISKQSGFKFEIIDTGSWSAAYDMLVNGEIDLLPAVYYNEKRAQEVLFSTQAMCSIYTTLNVRMDDQRYNYEDFQAFEGMNIGVIRDGIDGDNFRQFCEEHDLTVEIIDYDETSDLLAALDNGSLDGVAITHLGKNSTFRSVAQFSPSPLYFTVTKQRADIMAEINQAMNEIQLGNPRYGSDLYDKYLAASVNQRPVFTKEEQLYIDQAEPIIVAYDPSFAPLSYQDKKTGEFDGVVADVFQFIKDHTGLQFQFEAHTQAEALQLLQQGKIDVMAISDGDYLWDGRYGINSTLYYLRAPTSMITIDGKEKVEVLALPEGYQLSESIAAGFPEAAVKYYSTIEQCLEAMKRHEADAACMNTQVAGTYVSKSDKTMQTAILGQYINEMSIGVSTAMDTKVFSIINKCIQYLPAEQIDASLVAHAGDNKELSAIEFIEQYTWELVGIVCLVLGVIILLISYNLRNALRSNRRIQNLLYQDELTKLFNMDGFCRAWEAHQDQLQKQDYALLYADITQFKFINDHYGFAAGNQVLCACGKILQGMLQEDEFCGRLASDHFAILMNYENWDQLLIRLQQYVALINEDRLAKTAIQYKIELIFGVYLIAGDHKTDIHQKLDFANYARRHAKDTPGSFAVLYDERMRDEALLSQELEGGFERALQNHEFVVYYQPKVSMKDGSIIGSEALVRWNHPRRGFLTPGAFIPLFERLGWVKQIDLWLFEDVCKTMNEWARQGLACLPVSCNFSRLHFQNVGFPSQVAEIADRWKVPHDLLEIEITESALLEGPTDFEKMFVQLKDKGFRIAIDDFGSGYSSLGQLQHLTADVLKLDRSFVYHGVSEKREQIVVGNIIHMSKELGMSVVCEGIETLEQAEIIQEIGCRIAQGFYYYKPIPREAFEKLIKKEQQSNR